MARPSVVGAGAVPGTVPTAATVLLMLLAARTEAVAATDSCDCTARWLPTNPEVPYIAASYCAAACIYCCGGQPDAAATQAQNAVQLASPGVAPVCTPADFTDCNIAPGVSSSGAARSTGSDTGASSGSDSDPASVPGSGSGVDSGSESDSGSDSGDSGAGARISTSDTSTGNNLFTGDTGAGNTGAGTGTTSGPYYTYSTSGGSSAFASSFMMTCAACVVWLLVGR